MFEATLFHLLSRYSIGTLSTDARIRLRKLALSALPWKDRCHRRKYWSNMNIFWLRHTSMRLIGAYLRHEISLGQNDTIVLFSPNHVDYLQIVLGIIGANLTPVNPLYKELELATILEQSWPAVLIAHESIFVFYRQIMEKHFEEQLTSMISSGTTTSLWGNRWVIFNVKLILS